MIVARIGAISRKWSAAGLTEKEKKLHGPKASQKEKQMQDRESVEQQ